MKSRLLVLALVLAMLLSGCALVPDSYVSVTAHVEQYPQPEEATVSNYTELKNALLSLVEEEAASGELTASAYDGALEHDVETAITYVTRINPRGSYAVDRIDSELVRVGGYSRLSFTITYRRSRAELDRARTIRGVSGVRGALEAALKESDSRLVLLISYYEPVDFAAMVHECCEKDLTAVMAEPEVAVEIFPAQGSMRIVELNFTYPHPTAELRVMQSAVNTIMSSANGYVSYGQGDMDKAILLYSFLAERFRYTLGSSQTPAYALLCEGMADSRAFAAVYRAMCLGAGIECLTVHGTKDGEPYDWNILKLDGGAWHLDALADEQAGLREPQLLTDAHMAAYEWDREAYPACEGAPEPAPEPTAGAAPPDEAPDAPPELDNTDDTELPPEIEEENPAITP